MLVVILLSVALLSPLSCARGTEGLKCSSKPSKHICIPDNYTKIEIPNTEDVNKIGVSINIDEVLQINENDCSIAFFSYFNVEWTESRLIVDLDHASALEGLQPADVEVLKDLWLPNIFIYNLKTFAVTEIFSKLSGLWMDTNKSLLYSQAAKISFICPMNFIKFPLDKQRCKFLVGSYSYNSEKLSFITKEAGYSYKESNTIALDYDISILPLKDEDQVRDYGALGTFSVAGFEMVLARHVWRYIFSYYIPSGFLVMASWISFLIPPSMVTGRTTFLVILILAMVNIFNTVSINLPKAEGLTAIEVWMTFCLLFIVGALTEYSAILLKKLKDFEKQKEEVFRVDKFFLTLVPSLFFLFNIIYWPAYLL